MSPEAQARFSQLVLGFLRERLQVNAESVEEVAAHGNDWWGNTADGYDRMFQVVVRGRTADGIYERWVEGSDMQRLWALVVEAL